MIRIFNMHMNTEFNDDVIYMMYIHLHHIGHRLQCNVHNKW